MVLPDFPGSQKVPHSRNADCLFVSFRFNKLNCRDDRIIQKDANAIYVRQLRVIVRLSIEAFQRIFSPSDRQPESRGQLLRRLRRSWGPVRTANISCFQGLRYPVEYLAHAREYDVPSIEGKKSSNRHASARNA